MAMNERVFDWPCEKGEDWATLEATEPEGWPEYRRLAEHGLEEGSFAALASHESAYSEGAGWGLYDQGDYSDEGEVEGDYRLTAAGTLSVTHVINALFVV